MRRLWQALVLFVLAVLLWHVLWPARYRFPPPQPFAGDHWYNPYESFTGDTLRANFHAHASAWGGLSYGTMDEEEVCQRYRDAGYAVACITNYNSIAPRQPSQQIYIPAYEHGLNLLFAHQTVLGARHVSLFDYYLWQGLGQKQEVLDALAGDGELVVVNHPNRTTGYSLEELRQLAGYDLLEVATRFARNYGYWDAALSSGRLVWGLASDDGHDPDRIGHVGKHWVDVQAARTPESIYAALRAGHFYSSRRNVTIDDDPQSLVSCRIEDGALHVVMAREADRLIFIGQDGQELETVQDAREARYTLRPEDSYVRVEVETGSYQQFLNPVLRYDGRALPRLRAERLQLATWFGRAAAVGLFLSALVVLARRGRSRPHPVRLRIEPAG
jgi:hypothetical protein